MRVGALVRGMMGSREDPLNTYLEWGIWLSYFGTLTKLWVFR